MRALPQFTSNSKHPHQLSMDAMIDQMPDNPQRRHRRALSDTSFRHLDDILLFEPSDFDLSSLDLPATPTPQFVTPMAVDSDDSSSNPRPPPSPPVINHFRSLSVDSDFFDGRGLNLTGGDEKFSGRQVDSRPFHRHSNSMDGANSTESLEDEFNGMKKAMGAEKLAELSLLDPKRAKRILANRQSAARSKERKIRYTSELERKVQTLQTEATTLSAQVTVLQRDISGMTVENKELKLRLQAMEQQAHLQDALNEKLKEEVERLKIAAMQMPPANGSPYGRGPPPQYMAHRGHTNNYVNSQGVQHPPRHQGPSLFNQRSQ